MAPPSQLSIAASSVSRLLKEEASYHKELAEQEEQVAKLEASIKNGGTSDDGNDEFMLKQQVRLQATFGPDSLPHSHSLHCGGISGGFST